MAVNGAPAVGRRNIDRQPPGHPDRGEEKGAVAIEFDGRTIATTATGYLENREDWREDLARHLAKLEGIELTDRHRRGNAKGLRAAHSKAANCGVGSGRKAVPSATIIGSAA